MWEIVKDRLFLGNSNAGKGYLFPCKCWEREPSQKHILYVLNVAFDLDLPADAHVGLIDGGGNPLWKIRAAVSVLEEMARSPDHSVLVFCHEGKSRSVLVIAGYLARKNRISLPAALDLIREVRPEINPNPKLYKAVGEALSLRSASIFF